MLRPATRAGIELDLALGHAHARLTGRSSLIDFLIGLAFVAMVVSPAIVASMMASAQKKRADSEDL